MSHVNAKTYAITVLVDGPGEPVIVLYDVVVPPYELVPVYVLVW